MSRYRIKIDFRAESEEAVGLALAISHELADRGWDPGCLTLKRQTTRWEEIVPEYRDFEDDKNGTLDAINAPLARPHPDEEADRG